MSDCLASWYANTVCQLSALVSPWFNFLNICPSVHMSFNCLPVCIYVFMYISTISLSDFLSVYLSCCKTVYYWFSFCVLIVAYYRLSVCLLLRLYVSTVCLFAFLSALLPVCINISPNWLSVCMSASLLRVWKSFVSLNKKKSLFLSCIFHAPKN